MLLQVLEVHSFSWLCGIPLYKKQTTLPHASVGTVVCLPFCLLYKAAMSVLVLS